jgi:hypothetical protein
MAKHTDENGNLIVPEDGYNEDGTCKVNAYKELFEKN